MPNNFSPTGLIAAGVSTTVVIFTSKTYPNRVVRLVLFFLIFIPMTYHNRVARVVLFYFSLV